MAPVRADDRSHIRRGRVLHVGAEFAHCGGLDADMWWRAPRKVPPVIFPPGPSGYSHDGREGWTWLRRLIVWGVYIGGAVLLGPPAVSMLLGIIGALTGLG